MSFFQEVIWNTNYISSKLSTLVLFECTFTSVLILCTPSCHSWRKETFMVVISLSFFVRYPGMKMQWECHHLSTFLFSLWMTTLWGKYIGPDHLSLKSNIIEKIQMVYTTFSKKYFRDHLEPKRTILLNCSMNI